MRPRTLGLVLVIMACFAFNSLATRYLVSRELLDAAGVTITRFATGAGMLVAILAVQGQTHEAVPSRRDALPVLFLGGYALAIAYGYLFITAAAGTFVFYALVIATMTLGGPRPSIRAVAGAAIALAGVGVLAIGRAEGTTLLGVALLALTGATWGAYSLLLRQRGNPLRTNARAFVGVAVLSFLLLLDAHQVTLRGLAIGAFMGAITTALAYALWARVLPEITPIQAGTFQLLVPVLTAVGGVAALGEPFGARLAVAGALVLAGMGLATIAPRAPSG